MLTIYRLIMDERINPLAALPAAWTAIFCAGAGAWVWYGELVTLHVGILLGATAAAFEFKAARVQRARVATYRDHPVRDGTARYDDVWGG